MKAEQRWASIVKDEVKIGAANMKRRWEDYGSYLDMFDAERTERDYAWMSDIFIPEFPSHMITQSSNDVAQYFASRDFVETYVQEKDEKSIFSAAAAEACINKTLNRRDLYYFQKFTRGKLISSLGGYVYARCWWEKEYVAAGTEKIESFEAGLEEDGSIEMEKAGETEIIEDVLVKDQFNFDILDPRQVMVSPEHTYSIQDKQWVIVKFERSLNQLEADAKMMGYINLDKVGSPPEQTEVSKEVTRENDEYNAPPVDRNKLFDVYERHGWSWCKVLDKDSAGNPTKVGVGIDELGKPVQGADWYRTTTTIVSSDGTDTLIRFQLIPYKQSNGQRYYPIFRGQCYIHPTEDHGVGDGKYGRELQIAINDAFNMGNDRSRLATIPVMKGKKYSLEDNSSVFFEPGHTILMDDPNDLVEMRMQDNIAGQLNQVSFLAGKMSQADSIYPTTMGALPAASMTATAVAGTEQRSNIRANYKSLSFEYTFLTELYWMILQMTNQFAEPETGENLMGNLVLFFNPDLEYWYKPVSQSIESESSKAAKISQWTQILNNVVKLGNPKTVNFVLGEISALMGKEYDYYKDKLFPENQPLQQPQGSLPGVETPAASNQTGVIQSDLESMARGTI